jgi:hypothetical protein
MDALRPLDINERRKWKTARLSVFLCEERYWIENAQSMESIDLPREDITDLIEILQQIASKD